MLRSFDGNCESGIDQSRPDRRSSAKQPDVGDRLNPHIGYDNAAKWQTAFRKAKP